MRSVHDDICCGGEVRGIAAPAARFSMPPPPCRSARARVRYARKLCAMSVLRSDAMMRPRCFKEKMR